MQDKQQVQPTKNESVNAPNIDVTQIVKANEQHQVVVEMVV
jgi:hypothetical protein